MSFFIKRREWRALSSIICLLTGGCSYSWLLYDRSQLAPGEIPYTATMEIFEDDTGGVGIPEGSRRPIKDMVTEELYLDFSRNNLFKSISLKRGKTLMLTNDLGQLYVSGKIKECSNYGWSLFDCLAPFFCPLYLVGVPVGKRTGVINLVIDVTCVSNQKVIKEYAVRTAASQWIGWYYNARNYVEPVTLNEALTQAADQLKKAIVQDRDLFLKECPS